MKRRAKAPLALPAKSRKATLTEGDSSKRATNWKAMGVLLLVITVGFACLLAYMVWVPGQSAAGPISALTEQEEGFTEELQSHVDALSVTVGVRNIRVGESLSHTERYLTDVLTDAGFTSRKLSYRTGGEAYHNVEAALIGTSEPEKSVVIGAHYDTVLGSPGADDNASGVAAVLTLARELSSRSFERTVRFVLFPNEEEPFFGDQGMGSLRYAATLEEDSVVVMMSLESIGYYSDEEDSQAYPMGLGAVYPSKGDFIAFVSNLSSRSQLHDAVEVFRDANDLPSEGGALPEMVPGVNWSDHWAFWQHGFPAFMVTDMPVYRNPNYHRATDLPETLDFERMARLVTGLIELVEHFANE